MCSGGKVLNLGHRAGIPALEPNLSQQPNAFGGSTDAEHHVGLGEVPVDLVQGNAAARFKHD